MDDERDEGVCGGDPPPTVGGMLTGVGMTVAEAAEAIVRGESPPLSDLQRRIVEDWAERE